MSIRTSEKDSTTASKWTATGGWSGKSGSKTTTAFTSASSSLPAGASSQSMASGKATLLEAPTLSNPTRQRKTRLMESTPRWTRMTSGSTTLSTDLLLLKRLKLSSLSCRRMRSQARSPTSQSTSCSSELSQDATACTRSTVKTSSLRQLKELRDSLSVKLLEPFSSHPLMRRRTSTTS